MIVISQDNERVNSAVGNFCTSHLIENHTSTLMERQAKLFKRIARWATTVLDVMTRKLY